MNLVKELGLTKRLKDPREGDKHTSRYLAFHQDATKANGDPADPIRVVKANGDVWEKEDGLLGNETIGDIKFVVKKYGPGKHDGVYIRAIRVLKLVPYVASEFKPLSEDDEFFAEADDGDDFEGRLPDEMEPTLNDDEELNDDVP